MTLRAIIFDVDGTLAETEETHRAAFNRAFADAGLDWHWSEALYRQLLQTTGGRERIARYMADTAQAPDPALGGALHQAKNIVYAALVEAGAVTPRPGIVDLIAGARQQRITLAIATTTSRENLMALLDRPFGAAAPTWFAAIVTGEDVAAKKPDPEVYRRALDLMGCDASGCVAIEDSRNGLDAALAAGLTTIVTPARYTAHECFDGAALVATGPLDIGIVRRVVQGTG